MAKTVLQWSYHVQCTFETFNELTDAFLTHDWGSDGSTHKKVSMINRLLKAKGITTWFDEEKMEGNVKKQMIHGIDHARVIIVFITQRYIDKVGGDNAEDNCQLEFNYAARRKTASKMIPVLIDPAPSLKSTAHWTGEVGFVLGGHLYLDLSTAFDDEALLAVKVDELCNKILSIIGEPLATRFNRLQSMGGNSVQAQSQPTSQASHPSSSECIPLSSLSKEQVALLLNNISFSKYSEVFLENEITGNDLCGVASVDEIKEMGVALAAKARVLFDKINDFRSNGVPTSHLQSEPVASSSKPASTATEPSHQSPPETFEQLVASLLPADWIQLYNYKLESNGINACSSHELKWPDPPCSLSVSSGLYLNGDFEKAIEPHYEMLSCGELRANLDKNMFFISFQMKIEAGDGTPFCGGFNPWFGIDILKDMSLVLSFYMEKVSYVVRFKGEPLILPIKTWISLAILVNVHQRIVQVVVGTEKMDPFQLEPGFRYNFDNPTIGNVFYLVRRNSFEKLFHGYLRNIQLFSSALTSRPLPTIAPLDESILATHLAELSTIVKGYNLICNFANMCLNTKDTISGAEMVLPTNSFIHADLGTYFDGDYYSDVRVNDEVALASIFDDEFSKENFVFVTTLTLLGSGCIMCMGSAYRWFSIWIGNGMKFHVTLNNQDIYCTIQYNGTPFVLINEQSYEIAVKYESKQILVLVNGQRMDPFDVDEDFAFNAPPTKDNALFLVNYSNQESYCGFMKSMSMYSK